MNIIEQSAIPFNRPYLAGNEFLYIREAINYGKISGDGHFTKKCQQFFQDKFGFKKHCSQPLVRMH